MSTTTWRVLRGLADLESGYWCRRCDESIPRDDHFGQSESVCRGCRSVDWEQATDRREQQTGQTPARRDPSPREAAVRHILASSALASRCGSYIGEDIDWPELLRTAATLSGGEQVLVRLAHDLHEATRSVGVSELPAQLDDANFERVVQALRLYRGREPLGMSEVLSEAA